MKFFKNNFQPVLRFISLMVTLTWACSFPLKGAVIYADASLNSNGGGTQSNPYNNFHDAYANASDGDIIDLNGTFDWTNANETGDQQKDGYVIKKDLTIRGDGRSSTIIQADNTQGSADRRVFGISSDVTVTFKQLTIRYGKIKWTTNKTLSDPPLGGGAIGPASSSSNNYTVKIYNCKLNKNIANYTGSVNNQGGPAVEGGAIGSNQNKNNNKIIIKGSSITNNEAKSTKGNAFGGGVAINSNNQRVQNRYLLEVTNSTIANNAAKTSGGGIAGNNCSATIINSTIAHNSSGSGSVAGSSAGGIGMAQEVRLNLTNSTIAYNTTSNSQKASEAVGVDLIKIQTGSSDKTIWIKNTLIAQNTDGDNDVHDWSAQSQGSVTFNNNEHNFIEVDGTSHFSNGNNGNIVGSNQTLNLASTLNSNSTNLNTETLALNSGSNAIDAGATGTNGPVNVPEVDQRYKNNNSSPDIGSYERNATDPHIWQGSSGTSWNNASNWNKSSVPSSNDNVLILDQSNDPDVVNNRGVGLTRCNAGADLDISNNSLLTINENYIHHGKTDLGNGTLECDGSSNQTIQGSSKLVIDKLRVNNTNGVTAETVIEVKNSLDLQNGILEIPEESLIFLSGANVSNSGSSSFVDGPITKKGTSNFTFPTGDGSQWAPIKISNLGNSNQTFSAEYFKKAPKNPTSFSSGSGINNISSQEYWTLDRLSGSNGVNVTLYWKAGMNHGITKPFAQNNNNQNTLRVVKNSGSQWQDEGSNIGNSSNSTSGNVQSNSINNFSDFTFGSTSSSNNSLPVEFTNFVVNRVGQRSAILKWSTASETNNSHFRIQRRSSNQWRSIGRVGGHGTTLEPQAYEYRDQKPVQGTNYYRLKQVDFDGSYEYSSIKAVTFSEGTASKDIQILQNPVNQQLSVRFKSNHEQQYRLALIDATGQTVKTGEWQVTSGVHTQTADLSGLPAGVYCLILRGDQTQRVRKLIKE